MPISKKKIFISYKRNVFPDHQVATQIYEELKNIHTVFIDQIMMTGTRWAEQIEKELAATDYLIPLLSENSVHSEMVLAEIETAHRLYKSLGKPHILPIRLAYEQPFKYPLSAYLNPLNWAVWYTHEDTNKVVQEIISVVNGIKLQPTRIKHSSISLETDQPFALAQPVHLEEPFVGTLDTESKFYIKRPADDIALNAIQKHGATITIKAPRQMGKSSLLMHLIKKANSVGKRSVFLDFQLLDKNVLNEGDFYREFCIWLSDELGLVEKTEHQWKRSSSIGNVLKCTRYVSSYILKTLDKPLFLALDEVERIFDTEFREDFFSMLRGWHNNRSTDLIWKKLDLALVTSTEPYQFIENINQSPFNVGEVLTLEDFTLEQVNELNRRHGTPLQSDEILKLVGLLSGHPYLTRVALYLIASNRVSVNDFFNNAADYNGVFGDHLRSHLFRLNNKRELITALKKVIQNKQIDEKTYFRLSGAGLVKRTQNRIIIRCELYRVFFQEYLK